MKAFFWFCLVLLIPGLLLRLPIGGAGILATDIILPIFSITWIFQKIVVDRGFPKASFIKSGGMFLLFATITLLWGSSDLPIKEIFLSSAYLLRFASFLVFGWAASDLFSLFSKNGAQERFWKNFFIIASTVVFLGFIQFFLIPDISTWSTEGGLDPHTGRLLGTWLDPNFMAGFIGFVLPLLVGHWYANPQRKNKIILGILILLFLTALFLTFSRSGYVAAVVGLLVFFLWRDPKIILVGAIISLLGIASSERAQTRLEQLAGTVSAIVLQDTDEIDPTASLRMQSWERSFDLWKKYPLMGIGYNTYRYRASEEGIVDENYFSSGGSDSTHLTILVTTGIFGFLLFLYFYSVLFWKSFKQYRYQKNEIFLGFCAGLTALFIHGIFVNSLLFPFIFLPVMAVAGILDHKA